MPIQVFNIYTGNAYKGAESDASTPRVNGSGTAEADLGWGLALKRGTNPGGVVVGHNAGNVFAIAIREANHEAKFKPSTGETEYKDTESVSYMREGYINVEVTSVAAVEGAKLNVDDTTGEFTGGAAGAGETASLNVTAMEAGLVGDVIRARIDIL